MSAARFVGVVAVGWAAIASAVPVTVTLINTEGDGAYDWSDGLLTTRPLINVGLSPQPSSFEYATYTYANSHCRLNDGYCSGSFCPEDGNARVLAQRHGLVLGLDAWLVPAMPAAVSSTTRITIDVPVGSRLSFIAWVSETSVFDDFVSMYPDNGDRSVLSIPLFDSNGNVLPNITFDISGYDVNSTSATNGSGTSCSSECPTSTTGCYVAPGSASAGFPGVLPDQIADAGVTFTLSMTGPTNPTSTSATYTFTYQNTGTSAVTPTLSYVVPLGVTYNSSSSGGAYSSTYRTVAWTSTVAAGATVTRTVNVTLSSLGSTTYNSGVLTWTVGSRPFTLISSVIATTTTSTMDLAWRYVESQGRSTDGLALANLTNNSGSEILVVAPTRGATSGPGRAIVLESSEGTEVASFTLDAGRTAMGVPVTAQLTGNSSSTLEFVFGEAVPLTSSAATFARNGSATAFWGSAPYGYAGYWNMGPATANLSSSFTGDEILVADWDGNVRVLRGSNGAVVASANTWRDGGLEHAFGHAVVADVRGNSNLEVIVPGYEKGIITVFNGSDLSVAWRSASLKTLYGDVPYGSGPAVADVDADGENDIVLATRGTSSDVYVFDANSTTGSTCTWRFNPAGSFSYTSPVIGDVDGSGQKSIIVMSSTEGSLSVMKAVGTRGCTTAGGTIIWRHVVKDGERSNFTPVLYDVNGDGILDVITATNTRLEILDVANRQVLQSYDDSSAAFMPSAVVGNADSASSIRELYVSGWKNSTVYRFDLPSTATSSTEWTTFMGSNARTGAR